MKTRTIVILGVIVGAVLLGFALLYPLAERPSTKYYSLGPSLKESATGPAEKKAAKAPPATAEAPRPPVEAPPPPPAPPKSAAEAPRAADGGERAAQPGEAPRQQGEALRGLLTTPAPKKVGEPRQPEGARPHVLETPKYPKNVSAGPTYEPTEEAPKQAAPVKNGAAGGSELASEAPKQAGGPASPFAETTRKLQDLLFGNIAYNAPHTMKRDEETTIHLVLDLKKPIEDLKALIQEGGEKRGAQIQVSSRMTAQLTGADFTIKPITPDTQAVAEGSTTEWKWAVQPNSAGRHQLHLAVWALITVEGQSTPGAVKTYDSDIDVYVPWPAQFGEFVGNNWQWLWTTLLVPAAVWLWKRRKGGTGEG